MIYPVDVVEVTIGFILVLFLEFVGVESFIIKLFRFLEL